jgi:hypothetical protein
MLSPARRIRIKENLRTLILRARSDQEALLPTTHALRVLRIVREELRLFTGITFLVGSAHRS